MISQNLLKDIGLAFFLDKFEDSKYFLYMKMKEHFAPPPTNV